MLTNGLALTLALALAATSQQRPAADDKEAVITICEVSSLENQPIPAADAGALIKLNAKEGMQVTKDMEIARVDDREAQAQAVVKRLDFEVADQEAKSDIVVRLAQETSNVAKAGYDKLVAANQESKRTVTEIEVLRAKLEWKKAELQIEKAKEDNASAKLAARAKEAEADAADVAVTRRVLKAPFDGVVMQVYRHVGEWVSPGDPVVQIVRVDRLRVSGNLDASKWSPADIEGRPVTVEVKLPRGRVQEVQGKVVYVSPVVNVGQELPVVAEIDSPMENGRPVVRAGLKASMVIHVDQPPVPSEIPATAPRSAGRRTK